MSCIRRHCESGCCEITSLVGSRSNIVHILVVVDEVSDPVVEYANTSANTGIAGSAANAPR